MLILRRRKNKGEVPLHNNDNTKIVGLDIVEKGIRNCKLVSMQM